MTPTPLRAAVRRIVTTPPLGMYLIGYGDRAGGAASVHDDLTGTALVLDDGQTRAAIFALDILGLNSEVVRRIQQGVEAAAGIPADHVLICCSHTHSGPVGYAPVESRLADDLRGLRNRLILIPSGRQPRGWRFNKRYIDGLVHRLIGAAVEASQSLVPVSLLAGQGEAFIGHNRRECRPDGTVVIGHNPDGPIDRSVTVLSIRHGDAILATVVNFACHPTILGPNSYAISADWVGAMRAHVESQVGGLCLFAQGACGDVNPQMDWTADDWPDAARKGREVGEEVVRVSQRASPLNGAPIAAQHETVWASLATPPARGDGSTPTYQDQLHASIPEIPRALVDPLLATRFPWKTTVVKREGTYEMPIEVSALRLGDVGLAAVSMEPFTEIGQAVKEASPARVTLFAGYANGLTGYLPTASEHALGGYEIEVAPYFYRLPGLLARETDQQVIARMRALLERVCQ